jgi:hypothetical protein
MEKETKTKSSGRLGMRGQQTNNIVEEIIRTVLLLLTYQIIVNCHVRERSFCVCHVWKI